MPNPSTTHQTCEEVQCVQSSQDSICILQENIEEGDAATEQELNVLIHFHLAHCH